MRSKAIFALMGICLYVLAFVTSAGAAQGLPTVLPEEAKSKTDIISVALLILRGLSGLVLTCRSASGTTEEPTAGKALGPLHIGFKECEGELGGLKSKCTGLGEPTGEWLMLGEYHLVYDTGGTELGVAILLLVNSMHFACGAIVLTVMSGEQVCLIKEPYVLKELHEFSCRGNGKGEQSETYLNDSGTSVTPKLNSAQNEGTAETGAWEATGLVLWLTAAGADRDVLIMMT